MHIPRSVIPTKVGIQRRQIQKSHWIPCQARNDGREYCHCERLAKQSRLPRRLRLLAKTPSPQPLSPKGEELCGRMVLTLIPLPHLRLERQMVSGEDCLSAESANSAAAPDAALRPRETSGSGVAFFLDTFSWLRKKKYLASRATATVLLKNQLTDISFYTLYKFCIF